MRIEPLLNALKQEKAHYFQASSMSDRGRYYILHNLIDVFYELYSGYDDDKLDRILATLGQIKISEEQSLGDFLSKKMPNSQLLFKIPVFPITFKAANGGKNDLLVDLIGKVEKCKGHWLVKIDQDELKNNESVTAWQKQIITNSRTNEHRFAKFSDIPVSFLNRMCSNKEQLDVNSKIQEYISKCALPHEAKLSAFHFICRTGGAEMCDLLDSILIDHFPESSEWAMESSKSVNWAFDTSRKPICNTMLSVEIEDFNKRELADKHKRTVHHDPRLIKMNLSTAAETEPDVIIMSRAELQWAQETIIPIVSSVSISSQNQKVRHK